MTPGHPPFLLPPARAQDRQLQGRGRRRGGFLPLPPGHLRPARYDQPGLPTHLCRREGPGQHLVKVSPLSVPRLLVENHFADRHFLLVAGDITTQPNQDRQVMPMDSLFIPYIYNFTAIGFYNKAATLESSSILIYSQSMAGLYTQFVRMPS